MEPIVAVDGYWPNLFYFTGDFSTSFSADPVLKKINARN
jgi:hypothetical protein